MSTSPYERALQNGKGEEATAEPDRLPLRADYRAPNGIVYDGTFEMRILNADDRHMIVQAIATVFAGLEWSAIPPDERQRARMIATLTVMFRGQKGWVEWFGPWLVKDDHLLEATYKEVREFHARYFQPVVGASATTPGQPRIRLAAGHQKPPSAAESDKSVQVKPHA